MTRVRAWRLAVAASALLLVLVLAGGTWLVANKPRRAADGAVAVTISNGACDPAALSVPAGPVTFAIANEGDRVLEWEILDGVMVVEERENIAPGFTQRLTTRLDPGSYDITCGLLGSPRGRLTVTPSDAAPATKPSMVDLLGPLAEYRVFVIGELDGLAAGTAQLAGAVKAGDLGAARGLYAPTRAHYARIEPVAKLFSDLDAAIAVRAGDLPDREADAGFTGFHRLEYLLFAEKTLDGAEAVADRLVADVQELARRVKALTLAPDRMAAAAASLLDGAGARKLGGMEDPYSGTDLSDFRANIDGARKIVDLLHPLSEKADAALTARIDAGFAGVDAVIARYALSDGGFEAYAALSDADRAALEAPVATLAQDVATLRGALGLD